MASFSSAYQLRGRPSLPVPAIGGTLPFAAQAATTTGTYIVGVPLNTPQDGSAYSFCNVWVKTDGTPGGFTIRVGRWRRGSLPSAIAALPGESGWVLMSVRLQDFVQPTWCQRGDGMLDLRRIVRWSFGRNRWAMRPLQLSKPGST